MNLAQIRSVVPEIFDAQTKKSQTALNQNLTSVRQKKDKQQQKHTTVSV